METNEKTGIILDKNEPLGKITGYLLHLPEGYQTEKKPLIVNLHGHGAGGRDLNKIRHFGFIREVYKGKKIDAIIAQPQALYEWNDSFGSITPFIDMLVEKYNVDEDRISITGLSNGAGFAWDYAIINHHKIAAVIPIAGWHTKGDMVCEAKNLAVWAFHNKGDGVISYKGIPGLIEAFKKCGATNVQYTIYEANGHDAWTRTYADPAVLEWLLQQVKVPAGQEPLPPPVEEKPTTENRPPILKAADRTAVLPTQRAMLYGSAWDQDGSIQSFKWEKLSGGDITLGRTDEQNLMVTNFKEGVYTFKVTATDNQGAETSQEVKFTVTGKPFFNIRIDGATEEELAAIRAILGDKVVVV